MDSSKVAKFMALAGQEVADHLSEGTPEQRKLGAQLLLSEVLEYVICGLGVEPEVNGVRITKPDEVHYHASREVNHQEMLDGLADVAYTMCWNSKAFGLPLEAAFSLVCDNNLEKFVQLGSWAKGLKELGPGDWHCRQEITWPPEVVAVQVVEYLGELYAVGKDQRGKVRKPSSHRPVDLASLLAA